MGNRRFSLTTYVLVGISLVALYFVGKTVTPPPPAPPQEVTAAKVKGPSPAELQKKQFDDKKKMMEQKLQSQKYAADAARSANAAKLNNQAAAKPETFNPMGIDTTASYWNDPKVTEGAAGEKIMAKRVADATAKAPPVQTKPVMMKESTTPKNPTP